MMLTMSINRCLLGEIIYFIYLLQSDIRDANGQGFMYAIVVDFGDIDGIFLEAEEVTCINFIGCSFEIK